MFKSIMLACIAISSLGLSAAFAADKVTIPYDDSFDGIRVPWRNSGETIILYKVVKMGSKAGICGGYISGGGSLKAVERQLLNSMYVKVGNTTIRNNMIYLTKLDPSADLENAKMTCRSGRKAWKARFGKNDPKADFSQRNFEY